MKTPSFWKNKSDIATLLQPLALVYEAAYLARRAFIVQTKLSVPVVCIGNITAGGSGKTPVALHIGKLFKEKNINAFFVSRGYGGSAEGPLLVNPAQHSSAEVGDEPLLLSELLPTVVGKDRLQAARLAISQGAKLLIFDDGFQNKKIFKNYSFLVIDGMIGFGNGMLLPAGPLRERYRLALARAHAVVMINPTPNSPGIPQNKPVLTARTQVIGLAERLRKQKVVAFCGIAWPEKFQATLSGIGANVISFHSFADHAPYHHNDLIPLAEIASKEKAYMVTTRKDYVRLPPSFKDKVVVVDTELRFNDPGLLQTQIDAIARLV